MAIQVLCNFLKMQLLFPLIQLQTACICVLPDAEIVLLEVNKSLALGLFIAWRRHLKPDISEIIIYAGTLQSHPTGNVKGELCEENLAGILILKTDLVQKT